MVSCAVRSLGEGDGNAVAFLGAGRIACCLISTFLKKKVCARETLLATHHDKGRADDLQRTLDIEVTTCNQDAVLRARIVILCVRPLQLRSLLAEIAPLISQRQTVVSVVVGVPLSWIRKFLPSAGTLVHVHPTSLAMAAAPGISYIACENDTWSPGVREIEEVFQALGRVDLVSEGELDALAVAAGCSPAFWARLASLWCDTMHRYGVSKETATDILSVTLQGVGYGLGQGGISPEDMVSRIATPQGVTAQGLEVLQREGVARILDCVAESCSAKIAEIRGTLAGLGHSGI